MIVFAILIVLFLASIAVARSGNYDLEDSGLIAAMIVGFVLLFCSLGAGCAKLTVQGDLAAVRALREAASVVDLRSSEDVYGKVVDFNTDLASKKWFNRQWWADPFVPDEWEDVPEIPVNLKERK